MKQDWISEHKKQRVEFDEMSGESCIECDSVPCFDHMEGHTSHIICIGMTSQSINESLQRSVVIDLQPNFILKSGK